MTTEQKTYKLQIASAFVEIKGDNFRDAMGKLLRDYPNLGRLIIKRVRES